MDGEAFQRYLREHIPLSEAMATEVLEAGPDQVTLQAPLAPNLNHRATAFGGSVSALAILAGWGLVHLRLRDHGFTTRTVVQRSDVAYLRPVEGAFQARATAPSAERWDRLVRSLRRWGRGRIHVRVDVISAGVRVARLEADYVAIVPGKE